MLMAEEFMHHIPLQVSFTCDSDPHCQEYLQLQDCCVNNPAYCCFSKVEDLRQDYADCLRHGKKCKVPGTDATTWGTSCTSFSHYNKNMTNNKGSVKQEKSNKSTDTFDASLGCMQWVMLLIIT